MFYYLSDREKVNNYSVLLNPGAVADQASVFGIEIDNMGKIQARHQFFFFFLFFRPGPIIAEIGNDLFNER